MPGIRTFCRGIVGRIASRMQRSSRRFMIRWYLRAQQIKGSEPWSAWFWVHFAAKRVLESVHKANIEAHVGPVRDAQRSGCREEGHLWTMLAGG
jgi:hypothetical protein